MSTDRVPVIRRVLPLQRVALLGAYVGILAVQLLQAGSRTTFDTKLDLLVDPAHFLSQSRDLWSPYVGMGEIQNQAYGYLFPIGPIFWLAHVLAVPGWLTERVWSAALMLVAFEGARRLALAWGGLDWRCALLVGAAFVSAPRFLTTVGALTGELLPTAVLPWAVLPLVLARRGRVGPYVGPLLSGVAILFMGGQNAVETAATLPLPAILLVHAVLRAELPWRSLLVWGGAVVAACAWWVGPLVLLGAYSPPFLDFIESASNTTSQLSWLNSVRGADHWVAYVTVGGQPWWPAGYALATSGWLIVLTALVAALSLAGLVGRDVPYRTCLLLPLVVGLVCLVAAHGGWSGGLFAAQLRSLLDGPLAPLRNVHKVDPLVRLPMALGLGYLARDVALALTSRLRLFPALASRSSAVAATATGCCAAVVLCLAAQPALAGELRQEPGWSAIPEPWVAAADAIDDLPAGSRVLVVPASGFGLQVWGHTIDEPLQPLTAGSWASRGQAPLAPGGSVRLLDSVESLLESGRGSAGLAVVLARSGFTHVLVRTDLDPSASDAPDPSLVQTSLALSVGMMPLRSFGVPPGASLPLQLWRVDVPSAADPRVTVVPDSAVRVVQGGPESLLTLLQTGLLRQQPVVLAGQDDPLDAPVDILTDTVQRREQAFGRVHDATSSIMTAADEFRLNRAAHAYPAFPGQEETVAYYPSLRAVSATSSGGYVDILGAVRPEQGPYSALDSDESTAWVTAPFTDPVGQSLTVQLDRPVILGTIPVRLWVGGGEPAVTSLTLVTDTGSTVVAVPVGASTVTVAAPPGATSSIRVVIAGVDARRGTQQVGIADLSLSGVDASRTLVVPGAAGVDTRMLFSSAYPVRACTFPQRVCDLSRVRPAEEAAALDRSFRVAEGGEWRMTVGAVARSSPATAQLLAPVAPGYAIAGSSVLGGDPVVGPAFALDGDPLTSWVTDPGDATPTLSLSWPSPRTLSRIQVGLGSQSGVRLPTTVDIRAGGEHRTVPVGPGFFGYFPPLRTDHVSLTFRSGGLHGGGGLPMEVAEVVVDGLEGVHYAPSPRSATGQPCGFGPAVFVDGIRHETRVTGTLGKVLAGSALAVSLCGGDVFSLGEGPHRIRIASTAQFQPVQVRLEPAAPATRPHYAQRSVAITSWGGTHRSMAVGPGAASIIWVPENQNAGWAATAAGQRLPSVTVDGWAQGWRLPAGPSLEVTLTFTPQRTYSVLLVVGGALALLLLLGPAFLVLRRRVRKPYRPVEGARGFAEESRSAHSTLLLGYVAVAVAAAVAGIGLFVGALIGLLPGARSDWVRRSVVVAALGVAAWWQVATGGDATGADLLAGLAVGVVVAPDFRGRDRTGGQRSTSA